MIKFNCDNCDQRIQVDDTYAGKKGKCPKCKSTITVPEAAIASAGEDQATAPAAAGDSPAKPREGIAAGVVDSGKKPAQGVPAGTATNAGLQRTAQIGRPDVPAYYESPSGIRKYLIPSYDEISMFLMSVTVVLVGVCSANVRAYLRSFMSSVPALAFIGLYALMYVFGLVLSGYHIFCFKDTAATEKYLMLFFAVITNGVSGLVGAVYVLRHSMILFAVFPILNIVSGGVLILMLWVDTIDRDCIDERDGTPLQALVGLVVEVALFAVCTLVFKLNWAVTFSICIAYATNVNHIVQGVFRRSGVAD